MSANEDWYKSTSTKKVWEIRKFGETAVLFDNDNIISESIVVKQSVCSENELRFGGCNSSTFEVSILNDGGASLVGEIITVNVSVIVDNVSRTTSIGKFKILEDDLSSDRRTRRIKAVDGNYALLNEDLTEWYNNLTFPMTIRAFRTALFTYFASKGTFYPQTSLGELISDNISIEKTIDSNDITGAMVLTALCEMNGVFGRIVGNYFEYFELVKEYGVFNLYPSEDLYPSEELYPSSQTVADEYTFNTDEYYKVDYANYRTKPISKVIVRMEENDIGATSGVDGNTYVLQNNFLCYGMDAQTLQTVADNLLSKIGGIEYTPIKSLTTYGNPTLKVGDAIGVMIGNRKYIKSYILERTLTGVNALKDSYVANGVESYEYIENNTTAFLNQLRAKTAKVQANVEGVAISVTDLAEQTEASLELKVGKDENDQVVSMINASADVVSLKGNRVEIESDNFKLDRAGNVSAKGTFTSTNEDGLYAELNGNSVKCYQPDGTIRSAVGGGKSTLHESSQTTFYGAVVSGSDFVNLGLQSSATSSTAYYRILSDTAQTVFPYDGRHLFRGIARFLGGIRLGSINTILESATWHNAPCVNIGSSTQNTGLYVYGDFSVTGSKNRAVKTSKGFVGMNAYETAYAQFGDNGSGACDDKGLCEIEFEPIFAETIDLSKPYQVFITQTSEKVTKWVEKKADRFIVHGEPGATFDYMVVARQKGYADVRLEEIDIPSRESEVTE